jgi:hypothetical protein
VGKGSLPECATAKDGLTFFALRATMVLPGCAGCAWRTPPLSSGFELFSFHVGSIASKRGALVGGPFSFALSSDAMKSQITKEGQPGKAVAAE